MRLLNLRGSARYNYGKRVYRKYQSLDEQRKTAAEKLKFSKENPNDKPTKEEMFAQIASFDDLILVIQLIVGGSKERIGFILRTLDDYSRFVGDPLTWAPVKYQKKEVTQAQIKKSKRSLSAFLNGKTERRKPTRKPKEKVFHRDEQGEIQYKIQDVGISKDSFDMNKIKPFPLGPIKK